MVSDSVINRMVTMEGQEATEKFATQAVEVVNLKQHLQYREVDTANYSDACEKHDNMGNDLHDSRNVAREQLNKAEREIDCGRDGISEENQPERWLHTMESGNIFLSSKNTLCEGIEERGSCLSRERENIVMKSELRSSQKELEGKLWDHNSQFCGIHNVNWLEKFNDISNLCTQLDSIVKSLSISETGLVSLGSHDLEHLDHKAFADHVAPTSPYDENKTVEESNTHVHDSYDYKQLKHMSKEELVNYFNFVITKMRRDHESAMHQKTEKYFRLKRKYLKESGSLVTHRKDEEFDVLRKKIPQVISKLEDFLLENEKIPELINNFEGRLESLLSENRQIRDCLTDKKNEVKVLEAHVSTVEKSCIEASISEEVYKCAMRELIGKSRRNSEDSLMQFHMMQEIYGIILKTAAMPCETTSGYEIEDSDVESLIMQVLSGMVFREAINDAGVELNDLHREVQIEKETRIYFETKAVGKGNKLIREVEEKERLKEEILKLQKALVQKEKVAGDLSISLSKEREQFEVTYRELTSLRELASQHQKLAAVSNRELELLRAQFSEALEQIKIDKMEMGKVNHELDQTKEVVTEACKERNMALALAQEKHEKLLFQEAREENLREEMEMAFNNILGLTHVYDDFECKISSAIKRNNLRLENATCHLKTLTKTANELKRTRRMYKKRMEGRCADLQMAEAEVDLLGDEVDALLRLLEKIFVALDHYSPILKHYPGIIEILELVRMELKGKSTKLSRSVTWKG